MGWTDKYPAGTEVGVTFTDEIGDMTYATATVANNDGERLLLWYAGHSLEVATEERVRELALRLKSEEG